MKLLGWMHRKLRQNNGEHLKEFALGNSCTCLMGQPSLDDLQCYPKPNYYAKPSTKAQRDNQLRKSFACLDAARADDEHMEVESSADLTELFHGFLAIGTLGTEPITTDPATPTFATSVENIMEKETEATENELKLINDELEKVLGAEGKEDGYNDSSGRSSYVSIGRSSHGSTITLSGKALEAAANNENEADTCPLQGYLFGSAIGLPEKTTGKKEHRTSLGELFQKTKMAEQNTGPKYERGEKQKEKDTDKSAVHLMKKILRRKILQSTPHRSAATSEGTMDSSSADKKLHKILHMFHRKVHPEGSVVEQKSQKCNFTNEEVCRNRNQMRSGEDITTFPPKDKKSAKNTKSNMPELAFGASDSNGNRECWIKSDADYLVLEL